MLQIFKSGRKIFTVALCAFLIAFNWLLNIYAAYSDQLVEASMGQYITPIVIICSGIFILKEKIRYYEAAALLIAFTGVVILTVNTGKIPVIAVLLILTFSVYTFLKKTIVIDPLIGITAETALLTPFALAWLIYTAITGGGSDQNIFTNSSRFLLTASSGIFTALPLVLFSYGVKKINLSKLGFIQYYAPSLNLVIGVLILGETFSELHLISFLHIWISILIVIFFSLYHSRRWMNAGTV
jgi:chloramphenicol-sensitive protein RarD